MSFEESFGTIRGDVKSKLTSKICFSILGLSGTPPEHQTAAEGYPKTYPLSHNLSSTSRHSLNPSPLYDSAPLQ